MGDLTTVAVQDADGQMTDSRTDKSESAERRMRPRKQRLEPREVFSASGTTSQREPTELTTSPLNSSRSRHSSGRRVTLSLAPSQY